MKIVGSMLAGHRCGAQLLQRQAAAKVGLSVASIANSEKGRQWLPLPVVVALLRYYRISLSGFFMRVENELEASSHDKIRS